MAVVLETSNHPSPAGASARPACAHCGQVCPPNPPAAKGLAFCCPGCRMVYEILAENGLTQFYALEKTPGVRPADDPRPGRFAYLDDPAVRRRLVDFSNGRISRITFRIPAIHCVACVWLLEYLYRLNPAIGEARVHFPRKELSLSFDERALPLSALVTLLASLGYEPVLTLQDMERPAADPTLRRLILKLGVAGFAFGNIMLLSFPSYLGLNPATEAWLQQWFGWFSILFATPVFLYSASGYWRAAWTGLRQRTLTIEVPIALGLAALFLQSLFEIITQRSEGYLDSFAGLVFLLLVGQWFQRKTYETLSFERDYRSYFPLSVVRKREGRETSVPVTGLQTGDRIVVRHGELVPADAVVMAGEACMDYSFVTGESDPVPRGAGEYVYAGGRQAGGAVELEVVKKVSQSYLTSLWNNEAFHKAGGPDMQSLTNWAGRWFTLGVILVAAGTAGYWWWADPSLLVRTFTSILLVACPCALALSAPFTFGSALRLLGRHHIYLRNPSVVERMAGVTALVFDKTGTLTLTRESRVEFVGPPLAQEERSRLAAVARISAHPASRQIARELAGVEPAEAADVVERPGQGIEGTVDGRRLRLGSAAWLGGQAGPASETWVSVDGSLRGRFVFHHVFRPGLDHTLRTLGGAYDLHLLTGDQAREAGELKVLLGPEAPIHFEQSPLDKLEYVRALQTAGRRVMMVGDGLNDAGALKQSDVGVAVSEDTAHFSPACDAILAAEAIGQLPRFLRFARASTVILKWSFAVSILYNVAGISFAAAGRLSPMVSAILMPLSSFSVISFALLATRVAAWRAGLR